jgi:hypothetical protein
LVVLVWGMEGSVGRTQGWGISGTWDKTILKWNVLSQVAEFVDWVQLAHLGRMFFSWKRRWNRRKLGNPRQVRKWRNVPVIRDVAAEGHNHDVQPRENLRYTRVGLL